MAKKKKNKRKRKGFFEEDQLASSEEWLAKDKLKAEEKAAYIKKKRKEKKKRKAKFEAELLIKKKAEREAGQIALKKLQAARRAIIDYMDKRAGKSGGFFDNRSASSEIKKEFLRLEKDILFFRVKE